MYKYVVYVDIITLITSSNLHVNLFYGLHNICGKHVVTYWKVIVTTWAVQTHSLNGNILKDLEYRCFKVKFKVSLGAPTGDDSIIGLTL